MNTRSPNTSPNTMQLLRAGEIVTVDSKHYKWSGKSGRQLMRGDLYIAERNIGPHILTTYAVNPLHWWVIPDPILHPTAYHYDCWECLGVVEVK